MTVNYKELIREKTNNWNIRDDLKDFDLEKIRDIQPKMGYSVCCANITGDLNVGNIVRSSVIFGAEAVFILGRTKLDKRSTVGAENYIPIYREDMLLNDTEVDFDKVIAFIAGKGWQPVFVEKDYRGIHYSQIPWNYRPCFIFGNEGMGIPVEVLDKYKTVPIVSVNQPGVMRSLNVSVAAGIILNNFSERYGDRL